MVCIASVVFVFSLSPLAARLLSSETETVSLVLRGQPWSEYPLCSFEIKTKRTKQNSLHKQKLVTPRLDPPTHSPVLPREHPWETLEPLDADHGTPWQPIPTLLEISPGDGQHSSAGWQIWAGGGDRKLPAFFAIPMIMFSWACLPSAGHTHMFLYVVIN